MIMYISGLLITHNFLPLERNIVFFFLTNLNPIHQENLVLSLAHSVVIFKQLQHIFAISIS